MDAQKSLKKLKKPFIAFSISTLSGSRSFDNDRIASIIKDTRKRFGGTQFLIDKPVQNIKQKDLVNLTGKLTIRQSAAIINECDVVVTPDTGIYHLASALGKNIVAYFAAMDHKLRQTSKNARHLSADIHCYPCNEYSCKAPGCIRQLKNKQIIKAIAKYVS